jgi:hypothetical protein
VSFWWEGVGIESYEGVFRAMSFEGVVESEEPREVSGVRYKSCPDYFMLDCFFKNISCLPVFSLTFLRLCGPFSGRHFGVRQLDNCLIRRQ